jgi:hypothetical protein
MKSRAEWVAGVTAAPPGHEAPVELPVRHPPVEQRQRLVGPAVAERS